MRNMLKNNYGRKISYNVWGPHSKVAKFTEYIAIDLALIFGMHDFFVRILVF